MTKLYGGSGIIPLYRQVVNKAFGPETSDSLIIYAYKIDMCVNDLSSNSVTARR